MSKAIVIYIVSSKISSYVAVALRGAFKSAIVVARGKYRISDKALVSLLRLLVPQQITVIVVGSEGQYEAAKVEYPETFAPTELLVYPDGGPKNPRSGVVVYEPEGKVMEGDRVVEKVLRYLIEKKLLKAL